MNRLDEDVRIIFDITLRGSSF